jgi:hypothetical protein
LWLAGEVALNRSGARAIPTIAWRRALNEFRRRKGLGMNGTA